MTVLLGILLFSLIETVAVAVWAAILFDTGVGVTLGLQVLALVVLFALYTVEHIVALNVSKGHGLFDFPRL